MSVAASLAAARTFGRATRRRRRRRDCARGNQALDAVLDVQVIVLDANANAGLGNKTVTASAETVNDGNSGNNYTVTYVSNTVSTINPASLTIDTSTVTKTYDGTLAANGTATLVSGTLFQNASNANALDSVSGGAFAFTNANAGSGNKTVTTSGVTVADGNGGNNYTVTYVSNTASTINPAA
jgi:hypothetical protein